MDRKSNGHRAGPAMTLDEAKKIYPKLLAIYHDATDLPAGAGRISSGPALAGRRSRIPRRGAREGSAFVAAARSWTIERRPSYACRGSETRPAIPSFGRRFVSRDRASASMVIDGSRSRIGRKTQDTESRALLFTSGVSTF
jgi:hypothetical protein